MLPGGRLIGRPCPSALLCLGVHGLDAQERAVSPEASLVVDGLGRGTVALDGMWQFHTGDDLAWANLGFDDSGWERRCVVRGRMAGGAKIQRLLIFLTVFLRSG